MNSKDKGKSKLGLLGVAAAVILVVIVAGAVFMKRYAPEISNFFPLSVDLQI